MAAPAVHISSNFDAGNIEVVDSSDPADVQLKIKPDVFCEGDNAYHNQWFYFRAAGAIKGTELKLNIVNAGSASYPIAWHSHSLRTKPNDPPQPSQYLARASYDREDWFQVPTTYDQESGVLSIQHTPSRDACYYAYFAPYSHERHQDLVSWAIATGVPRHVVFGTTLDGHDLDLLRFGTDGPSKRQVWVVARQHPGESMAEWCADGLIRRLCDRGDDLVNKMLEDCVWNVVPNINPDGSIRGHLRCNAAGANLNREWKDPTLERSPEVYHVLRAMDSSGCDAFVDIHGDEELPFNFISGSEGCPNFTPHMAALQERFMDELALANPAFQTAEGYEVDLPNEGNLAIGSNAICVRYGCLSVTLEQPFKDVIDLPDPEHGWSPHRAQLLGRSLVDAMFRVRADLR